TVFGRDIAAAVGVGLQAADRTCQNDRAAVAACDDMWHTGFHRFPDAGKVYVDHLLPVVFAGLVQGVAAVADAGVGHDDVQPAKLFDAAIDRGFERVVVAHVDFGRDDPAVETLYEVGRFGEVLRRGCRNGGVLHDRLTDVDGDDVRAFLRQSHRVAAALTARRPGDEGNFSLNAPCHVLPLLLISSAE